MEIGRIAILLGIVVGLAGAAMIFYFQHQYLELNRARGYPDGPVGRGKGMPRSPEFHRDAELRDAWRRMVHRARWSAALVIGGPLLGLFITGLLRRNLL